MTKNQKSLYFRTWATVRKMLIDWGGFSAAEADQERHKIHLETLGTDKSSAALTNTDFDAILDAFESYLVLLRGPIEGPSRASEMPRRRLIWAIRQTGLSDPYINAIASDEFHVSDWLTLPEEKLNDLRFTCVARSRAKARAAAVPA